ncbi:hypothetical protein ColLi_09136 [Colletotrichum liriopes]|uniref:Uncharacterized protein n=1 Tax=Colletotrichum liriopes TaxID=708192 RepID=A0AA37GS92_9PEZI|nr:hypothetical protein ColLi_09136 [Colletotrichum liriopes]
MDQDQMAMSLFQSPDRQYFWPQFDASLPNEYFAIPDELQGYALQDHEAIGSEPYRLQYTPNPMLAGPHSSSLIPDADLDLGLNHGLEWWCNGPGAACPGIPTTRGSGRDDYHAGGPWATDIAPPSCSLHDHATVWAPTPTTAPLPPKTVRKRAYRRRPNRPCVRLGTPEPPEARVEEPGPQRRYRKRNTAGTDVQPSEHTPPIDTVGGSNRPPQQIARARSGREKGPASDGRQLQHRGKKRSRSTTPGVPSVKLVAVSDGQDVHSGRKQRQRGGQAQVSRTKDSVSRGSVPVSQYQQHVMNLLQAIETESE